MEKILTVGIKELKNSLSAMIREVQRGVRILVTDRNQVVAELREPFGGPTAEEANPVFHRYVREGKIRAALHPNQGPYSRSPLQFPDGSALADLEELRKEKGR